MLKWKKLFLIGIGMPVDAVSLWCRYIKYTTIAEPRLLST
jgi:hypothetical protein